MKGMTALGFMLLLSMGAALRAAPAPPPPAVTLETAVSRVPGRLLASAVARDGKGRYGLALLVAEGTGKEVAQSAAAVRQRSPIEEPGDDPAPGLPRAMYFLPAGAGAGDRAERLTGLLPEKVSALATLVGGDESGDRLILGEPGVLYALDSPWGDGETSSYRKVYAAPGVDLRSLHRDRAGEPSPRLPWVPVAGPGRLQLLTAEEGAGKLHPAAEGALPQAAARETWGIQLTSPAVSLLPPSAPGAPPGTGFMPRFAAGPDAQGQQRLRTILLSATAGEAPVEAWSMLPGPAVDMDSSFALWDGRPVLAVAALPHIGVFVERDLQIFSLTRDRSRAGSPPLLSVHTDCHLWQALRVYFVDLGATGRQDLVVMHREGLRGKKLRFQVHVNDGAPGQDHLAAQPRSSSVDVEARDWFYGADFTGDGIPDLLVEDTRGHLLLYRGVGRTYRLADKPSWSFDLPDPGVAAAAAAATRVNVSVGTGGGAVDAEEDGDDESPENAGAARRTHAGLAGLVDLRGDGHQTLYLAFAEPNGGTRIVAVAARHPS